jgi:hypothetical protein
LNSKVELTYYKKPCLLRGTGFWFSGILFLSLIDTAVCPTWFVVLGGAEHSNISRLSVSLSIGELLFLSSFSPRLFAIFVSFSASFFSPSPEGAYKGGAARRARTAAVCTQQTSGGSVGIEPLHVTAVELQHYSRLRARSVVIPVMVSLN